MDLQEILGADYKEGMTAEEVNSVFESRLLKSGKYENKDKVEAERRESQKKLSELQNQIDGKLTDDEKKSKEFEDLKRQLQELTEREKASKIDTSRLIAKSNMAEAKTLLEIKDNDKEFTKFMEAISVEDKEVANDTSNYVMKLVKEAYEKGKAESTKNNFGQMGKMAINQDGKTVDPELAFVKQIAAQAVETNKAIDPSKSNFN